MEKITDSIFKFLRLDSLIANVSGYIDSRLELYKIEIREEVGKAMSKAMVYIVMAFFAFLFMIFFSLGLAHFINYFLEASFAGYWIVAAIYGLAFGIILIFKKDIDSNFEKRFIEITKRKVK